MHNRKHFRVGAFSVLLSAGLLSGCVTAQPGFSPIDNEGKREFLSYAASQSPVYLKTLNWPSPEGDAAASAAAAGYAKGAIFGSPAEFTADPEKARYPDYNIVIAVNLPPSTPASRICGKKPVPGTGAAERMSLTFGFCSGGEALSTSVASGPAPQGAEDEAFRRLVQAGMQELFPSERERDPNERSTGTRLRR